MKTLVGEAANGTFPSMKIFSFDPGYQKRFPVFKSLSHMGVKNIKDLSNNELVTELQNGGKFVVYYYTISIVIMTFRQGSNIYFLRSTESPIKFGWKFLLLSTVLGWWGFPWGPIYTLQSCYTAFVGKDVTKEVMAQLSRGQASTEVTYDKKF